MPFAGHELRAGEDSRDGLPPASLAAELPGRAERDRTQAGGILHAGRGAAVPPGGNTGSEAWGRAPALRTHSCSEGGPASGGAVAHPGGGEDSRDGYPTSSAPGKTAGTAIPRSPDRRALAPR